MLDFNQIFGAAFENGGQLLVGETETVTNDDGYTLLVILGVAGLFALIGVIILHVIYWLTYPVSVWIMVFLNINGFCTNLWSLLVPAYCKSE